MMVHFENVRFDVQGQNVPIPIFSFFCSGAKAPCSMGGILSLFLLLGGCCTVQEGRNLSLFCQAAKTAYEGIIREGIEGRSLETDTSLGRFVDLWLVDIVTIPRSAKTII